MCCDFSLLGEGGLGFLDIGLNTELPDRGEFNPKSGGLLGACLSGVAGFPIPNVFIWMAAAAVAFLEEKEVSMVGDCIPGVFFAGVRFAGVRVNGVVHVGTWRGDSQGDFILIVEGAVGETIAGILGVVLPEKDITCWMVSSTMLDSSSSINIGCTHSPVTGQ